MRDGMLNTQRPTHDVGVFQIWVRRLDGAEPVGPAFQNTCVAGARVNIASVYRSRLIPVELPRHRRLHATRHCRGRERQTSGPDVADRRVGCHTGRTTGTRRVHCTLTKQESAGVGGQTNGRVVVVLLGEEDPPARCNVSDVGASAHHGPSIALHVPGETHARREVVFIWLPHLVGVFSQLQEATGCVKVRKLVVGFRDWRGVLIAHAKVQHQPRCDAPVILEESCHCLSADVPARVANENLSIAAARPGHEVFQRAESDLATAAVECASVPDACTAGLASHLEGVMSAQIRNVIDELEDVIRAIVLGEAGAATDAAGEVGQRDVRKPADGFRCAVAEGNAVVGLAIARTLAIRCFEPLIKPVITKSERIDDGRTGDIVPLRSRKINPRIIARPPVRLSDGLIVDNQSSVRADVILTVDRILIAKMEIHLCQAAVYGILGVEASGNIGPGGAISVFRAFEH